MPVPIPPATPSTPPVAPQRTEPNTFSARMDAWLAWFNASFWVWVYDLVPWIQARANETEAWSNTASASAAAAGVSQATAAEAITVANAAMVTVTQQAAAAAATSGAISSVAAAASASATSASASSTAAAVSAERAVQAWAAAAAPIEQLAGVSQSLHKGTIVKGIIYDTSKDSDGGAWRKRCQGKSWYTETLGGTNWLGQVSTAALAWAAPGAVTGSYFQNSTDGLFYQLGASSPTVTQVYRGNVREFPAVVAVIAESSRVVIYDLTQGGSPMWRVYLTGANFALHSGTVTSVATINGIIAVCVSVGQLATLDFPADRTFIRNSVNYYSNTSGHKANSFAGAFVVLSSVGLVNNTVNDVAITVLDNAPIDPATGLPVPTIAVATAGGISVLKDDGTAVTIAGQAQAVTASYFDADNRIVATGAYQNELGVYAIPTSNVSYVASLAYYTNSGVAGGTNPKPLGNSSSGYRLTRGPSKTVAVGSMNLGVSLLKENPSSQGRGMVNYITNAYNSGWLPGDIRGAFLADTVAETVTASGELVTNGTFTTDTSGWTTSNSTFVASAGAGVLTNTAAVAGWATTAISCVVGRTYTVSLVHTAGTSATGYVRVGTAANAFNISVSNGITGAFNVSFTATVTTIYITIGNTSAVSGNASSFDDVSVKLAEPDRSVKNKGLVINGTLTKTAVASGAGLVAYSGFSASNYLEQPYNSDLDFGTGDFCALGWVNLTSVATTQVMLDRCDPAGGARLSLSVISSAWRVGCSLAGGSINTGITAVAGLHCVAVIRQGGVLYVYVDAVLIYSAANTVDITNTLAVTKIGLSYAFGGPSQSPLALWRVSATAPSADQIAHIYRTELPLFQANAQCTLAGTSTAVTALAYDDVADELHVGTSWGRSEFKDLLRVASEATTTGSITSLSANEGVVINAGTSAKIYAPALYLRDELRRTFTASKALAKQLMWQEFYATEGQATFTCSKNGDVRAVYVNNILRKAPVDYTVSSDGFQNIITFTSGISAGIQVSVQTTRS